MDSWTDIYFQTDEILFERLSRQTPSCLAVLCREARQEARKQPVSAGAPRAAGVAARLGIPIGRADWSVADGRVVYLGECSLDPPAVTLNGAGLFRAGEALAKTECRKIGAWGSEPSIMEAVIAHELWHVIMRRPSRPADELSAHAFARELLGMPFSPLLYSEAIRRQWPETSRRE